jgi:hypothetical protein
MLVGDDRVELTLSQLKCFIGLDINTIIAATTLKNVIFKNIIIKYPVSYI